MDVRWTLMDGGFLLCVIVSLMCDGTGGEEEKSESSELLEALHGGVFEYECGGCR